MDKNYEERFQQLVEQYRHEEQLYDTMRKNCDERIEDIDRNIQKLKEKREKIEKEKSELKYPSYVSCLLPQVMELLNEAVADRGYQFRNKDFSVFGLSCETPVFQDYSRSEKETTAYFMFRPGKHGKFHLKKESGEYACNTSIAALNDFKAKMVPVESFQTLLEHIDDCERREPPVQLTEDEICLKLKGDEYFNFRNVPQSLWTYRTVTAAMQSVLDGSSSRFEEGWRIPIDMIDKEMFLLGLKAGVYFYHYLPQEKLEELGAYEEDFLAEKIRLHYTGADDVPVLRMTTGVLKKIIPGCGFWYAQEWAKKYQSMIDQEVADLLIKESTMTFEYIPEEFRTFEMCQRVYKEGDKSMRKFIPSRFLTESGRMKKKPC